MRFKALLQAFCNFLHDDRVEVDVILDAERTNPGSVIWRRQAQSICPGISETSEIISGNSCGIPHFGDRQFGALLGFLAPVLGGAHFFGVYPATESDIFRQAL